MPNHTYTAEILKETSGKLNGMSQKLGFTKEGKNIGEGINEGKIAWFIFLFLVALIGNSLK